MKIKILFYFLITFLSFLLIWELIVVLLRFNQTLFPTPLQVFSSFKNLDSLWADISISLIRLALGGILGITSAIIFGLFTGHFSVINKTLGLISNFFRFIPPLSLVPLFLIWFGIGEFSKISLLAWTTFFPVWISTHNGVRNIEKKYLLVVKSLNIKKLYFMKEIVLKGSMDYILNGARIGIGVAFSVLIASEMIGAYAGMGYRISFFQSLYAVDRMIAYILILGILGIILDRIFLIVSKKLTPWKNEI